MVSVWVHESHIVRPTIRRHSLICIQVHVSVSAFAMPLVSRYCQTFAPQPHRSVTHSARYIWHRRTFPPLLLNGERNIKYMRISHSAAHSAALSLLRTTHNRQHSPYNLAVSVHANYTVIYFLPSAPSPNFHCGATCSANFFPSTRWMLNSAPKAKTRNAMEHRVLYSVAWTEQ